MKDKRIWILLGCVLVVSAAFLLLNFRVATGNTQVMQMIMVLVGEGPLARALQKALSKAMVEARMGQMVWEQALHAKYPNPVLVVKAGQPRPLWTPFFVMSQFPIQVGYATDGDTTFMDSLDKTQPYIRNSDPSVVNLYTEYEVNDRSFGLISRPGYDRYLAEYLAREIIQALKNLYNIQDPTGGQF
jgi:hypothetical protein